MPLMRKKMFVCHNQEIIQNTDIELHVIKTIESFLLTWQVHKISIIF